MTFLVAPVSSRAEETVKAISLFSGAGGMDIGFEQAGFEVVVAVEQDPSCCKTLRKNRPKTVVINDDITKVTTKQILDAGGLKPREAAVVFAGPPCQPFSLAGERRGLDDPKGRLVMEFNRVVREALPMAFVMENVSGLRNWNGGEALNLFLEEFSKPIGEESYVVTYSIMDACDYGAPQHRERLIIVGNRMGKDFWFPKPSGKTLTVRNAICPLPPADAPSLAAVRVARSIPGRIAKHGF